jgi:hypothetical protein
VLKLQSAHHTWPDRHNVFLCSKLFYFLFFGETGVWTQDFALAKKVLYQLIHTCSLFCSDYFGDGGLMNYLPGLASNHDSLHLSLPSS